MAVSLRFAEESDTRALLGIYSYYIEEAVTFEYDLPTEEEFAERIRNISSYYPYLVCEEDGEAIGYAYAHRMFERAAYQWDAELSVYIAPDKASRGVGTVLYTALMELLKLQNIKTVYGIVAETNEKSKGLHKKLGFHIMGVCQNTGYKRGKWHNVVWFEKSIGVYDEPQPIISVKEADSTKAAKIIAAAEETLNSTANKITHKS